MGISNESMEALKDGVFSLATTAVSVTPLGVVALPIALMGKTFMGRKSTYSNEAQVLQNTFKQVWFLFFEGVQLLDDMKKFESSRSDEHTHVRAELANQLKVNETLNTLITTILQVTTKAAAPRQNAVLTNKNTNYKAALDAQNKILKDKQIYNNSTHRNQPVFCNDNRDLINLLGEAQQHLMSLSMNTSKDKSENGLADGIRDKDHQWFLDWSIQVLNMIWGASYLEVMNEYLLQETASIGREETEVALQRDYIRNIKTHILLPIYYDQATIIEKFVLFLGFEYTRDNEDRNIQDYETKFNFTETEDNWRPITQCGDAYVTRLHKYMNKVIKTVAFAFGGSESTGPLMHGPKHKSHKLAFDFLRYFIAKKLSEIVAKYNVDSGSWEGVYNGHLGQKYKNFLYPAIMQPVQGQGRRRPANVVLVDANKHKEELLSVWAAHGPNWAAELKHRPNSALPPSLVAELDAKPNSKLPRPYPPCVDWHAMGETETPTGRALDDHQKFGYMINEIYSLLSHPHHYITYPIQGVLQHDLKVLFKNTTLRDKAKWPADYPFNSQTINDCMEILHEVPLYKAALHVVREAVNNCDQIESTRDVQYREKRKNIKDLCEYFSRIFTEWDSILLEDKALKGEYQTNKKRTTTDVIEELVDMSDQNTGTIDLKPLITKLSSFNTKLGNLIRKKKREIALTRDNIQYECDLISKPNSFFRDSPREIMRGNHKPSSKVVPNVGVLGEKVDPQGQPDDRITKIREKIREDQYQVMERISSEQNKLNQVITDIEDAIRHYKSVIWAKGVERSDAGFNMKLYEELVKGIFDKVHNNMASLLGVEELGGDMEEVLEELGGEMKKVLASIGKLHNMFILHIKNLVERMKPEGQEQPLLERGLEMSEIIFNLCKEYTKACATKACGGNQHLVKLYMSLYSNVYSILLIPFPVSNCETGARYCTVIREAAQGGIAIASEIKDGRGTDQWRLKLLEVEAGMNDAHMVQGNSKFERRGGMPRHIHSPQGQQSPRKHKIKATYRNGGVVSYGGGKSPRYNSKKSQ